jgi:hypothetical protein
MGDSEKHRSAVESISETRPDGLVLVEVTPKSGLHHCVSDILAEAALNDPWNASDHG